MIDKKAIREYFQNDTFAVKQTGIVIDEVSEERVVCSLTIEEHHKNANGVVMGGVSYTLADFTFAVFANRHSISTVTLSATVQYLGVAKGKRLIATARAIKEGRSVITAEVTVTDELSNAVAHIVASGFSKR